MGYSRQDYDGKPVIAVIKPRDLLTPGSFDNAIAALMALGGSTYAIVMGGPLAPVRSGDPIELDVSARRLDLRVSEDELARRRAAWRRPQPKYQRGFGALFQDNISQANEGCDFRFLEGTAPTPEPEIH
jgi:dihydroxyacid dehydratase/phosphogluconate dehydratase